MEDYSLGTSFPSTTCLDLEKEKKSISELQIFCLLEELDLLSQLSLHLPQLDVPLDGPLL